MKWEQIAEARRILGREEGTILKDWGGKLAIALIYPNTYRVGMSSLGLQSLYGLFNAREDVACERAFFNAASSPGNDPAPISLESQRPLTDFGLLAFTLSFEMDYFHVVEMLRQAGIPPLAEQRDSSWPAVIAGGPAISSNPEPLAPVFDAIVIGEGEEVIGPLVDICQEMLGNREATQMAWAQIPGVYVPGRCAAEERNQRPVERLWVRDLACHPTHSVVLTPDTEFGDLYLIEIARGCRRGCRFCLAGYHYRPPRERPVDLLVAQAREGLQLRQRLGLVSAAVSDHQQVDDLAIRLRELGARISVSSLRTDSLTETLVRTLSESGVQTLTIAPEAGSRRLRHVINKTQSEEALLRAAYWGALHNFPHLKLYFMIGHPTETDADMDALVKLVREVRGRFQRRLTINLTPFVPKPHTPFQWASMTPAATLRARATYVKRQLRGSRVDVKADSPAWAEVQGVLARGDRRLTSVLLRMDRVALRAWKQALSDCELTSEEYLRRREPDEPLPWKVVASGVSDAYLRREWRLSQENRVGHSCPPGAQHCTACGVCEDDSTPARV